MGVRVRQKDGSWWIFIHHKRKRWAKKIGSKKAAEETARHLSARLTLGLDARNGSDSPTLQEYAAEWVRTYLPVYNKPRTAEFYESTLRNRILSALGSIRLVALSRQQVKALVADQARTGIARATLKSIVATLRALCNQAIDEGIITQNPAARHGRFYRGLSEKESRKIDAYTPEELKLLLEAAERHYPEQADLLTTAAWTGMRIGEVLGLQLSDIDFQGCFIEVRRTISRRKRGVQITSPKSGKQRRVVIPTTLTTRLATRRDTVTAQAVLDRKQPPTWVFPNKASKPKDSGGLTRRVWYPLLTKAGLRQLPPHALRHTYASILIQQGVPPAFIKQQLGHASIQTTVDIYGHLVPEHGCDWVERFASLTKHSHTVQNVANSSPIDATNATELAG